MSIRPGPAESGRDEPLTEVRLEHAGATYSGFIVGSRQEHGASEALVAFFCVGDGDPTPRCITTWFPYDRLTLVE